MFEFAPFDDDDDLFGGAGLSVDDLDLTITDDLPIDFTTMAGARPRWRRREWWHTTETEAHLLDYPDFDSAHQRMRFTLRIMAAPIIGGDDDAKVLEDVDGEMVSLNDLLDRLDAMENDRLMVLMDRQP